MGEATDVWRYFWNDKHLVVQMLNSQGDLVYQTMMDREEGQRRGHALVGLANMKLAKPDKTTPLKDITPISQNE